MLGRPKYDYGQKVEFEFDRKKHVGAIYTVDAYGDFFNSEEITYDILATEEDNCLYKHIEESAVILSKPNKNAKRRRKNEEDVAH